jgi:hypothetical protein
MVAMSMAVTLGACTVAKDSAPSLAGPSGFGISFTMAANPTVLPRDGSTQTTITIVARDESGQPKPNSRLFHLRRFYYDTAGSANPVNMNGLKTLVPTTQIVFGTDAPFFDGAPQIQGLQSSGFSADELRGIERENALSLIPRLRT